MLHGRIAAVPDTDVAADGGPPNSTYTVYPRKAEEARLDIGKYHTIREDLADGVSFSIFDGTLMGHNLNGLTRFRRDSQTGKYTSAHIMIAWQNIMPLLRADTTAAERLVHQFWVAKTIFHETCHVITGFCPQSPTSPQLLVTRTFFPQRVYG